MRRPQFLLLAGAIALVIGTTAIAHAVGPAAAVTTTRMLLRTNEYNFLRKEVDVLRAERRAQQQHSPLAEKERREIAAFEARFESAARVSDDYWEVRFAATDLYRLIGWRGELLASLPTSEELTAAVPNGGVVRFELPSDGMRHYMARVRNIAHGMFLAAEKAGASGAADAMLYRRMTSLFNEQQTLTTIERGYINLNRQMVDFLNTINEAPLIAQLTAAANNMHRDEVWAAHNEL